MRERRFTHEGGEKVLEGGVPGRRSWRFGSLRSHPAMRVGLWARGCSRILNAQEYYLCSIAPNETQQCTHVLVPNSVNSVSVPQVFLKLKDRPASSMTTAGTLATVASSAVLGGTGIAYWSKQLATTVLCPRGVQCPPRPHYDPTPTCLGQDQCDDRVAASVGECGTVVLALQHKVVLLWIALGFSLATSFFFLILYLKKSSSPSAPCPRSLDREERVLQRTRAIVDVRPASRAHRPRKPLLALPPPPHHGAEESVLAVRYRGKSRTVRHRDWRDVGDAIEEVAFSYWPMKEPRTTTWVVHFLQRRGTQPTDHHRWWSSTARLTTTDWGVAEHASCCWLLELAGSFDQLDLPNIACIEAVCRRMQAIE